MSSGLTSPYLLPYPIQTDQVDVASDIQALAEAVDNQLYLKATINSPTFTGLPQSTTAGVDTDTTQIATTAYVINQGYLKSSDASSTYAPIASPALTGNPTAPTQSPGNSSTRVATTAFVSTALSNFQTLPAQSYPTTSGQALFSDGADAFWANIEIKDVTGLETIVDDLPTTYAPFNVSIVEKTANHNIDLTDPGKQIEMNVSSANTITVLKDLAVPLGTVIVVVQTGTGQTTIVPATDVTINATPGLKLRTRWSVATLTKRGTNLWLAAGDLVA